MKNLIKILVPIISSVMIINTISCDSCKKEAEKLVISQPDTIKPIIEEPKLSPRDSILVKGLYTVNEGEGFYSVGEKVYGHEVMGYAIAKWNGLEIDVNAIGNLISPGLYSGMKLKVKKVNIKEVQPGDSWWGIANSFGISIDEAQKRFHWIGKIPNPGEVYFVEESSEKRRRGWIDEETHIGRGGMIVVD